LNVAVQPPGAAKASATLHAAVAAMFFALGVGVGLWSGVFGAILARSGIDAATFGVLMTLYTGAYLIAMSAGGALAHRFGIDEALPVSAILFGATPCALLDASSKAWAAIAFGAFALALAATAAAVAASASQAPRKA
jgi:hypothetical protein